MNLRDSRKLRDLRDLRNSRDLRDLKGLRKIKSLEKYLKWTERPCNLANSQLQFGSICTMLFKSDGLQVLLVLCSSCHFMNTEKSFIARVHRASKMVKNIGRREGPPQLQCS